jgi:hypothetical protein
MKVQRVTAEKVYPEPGTSIAILFGVIDWGTQTDSYGTRRKVELLWELPEQIHEFADGAKPIIVDRKFGATIGKNSGLREAIEGMLSITIEEDEYELETLIGTVCNLNLVIEPSGEYKNTVIKGYSPLGKSDQKRKFKNHNEYIVIDLDNFDAEAFKTLPDWKQKEIAKSPEYKEAANALPVAKAPAKAMAQPVKGAKPAAGGAKKLFK